MPPGSRLFVGALKQIYITRSWSPWETTGFVRSPFPTVIGRTQTGLSLQQCPFRAEGSNVIDMRSSFNLT